MLFKNSFITLNLLCQPGLKEAAKLSAFNHMECHICCKHIAYYYWYFHILLIVTILHEPIGQFVETEVALQKVPFLFKK